MHRRSPFGLLQSAASRTACEVTKGDGVARGQSASSGLSWALRDSSKRLLMTSPRPPAIAGGLRL